MTRIRLNATNTLTMGTAGLTEAVPFSEFAGGVLHMPAAWTAASIGFTVSPTVDGTFIALYDALGSIVQVASPAVSKAYVMPAEIFPCRFVKLWSQTGGTVVAQAAARTVVVSLKA